MPGAPQSEPSWAIEDVVHGARRRARGEGDPHEVRHELHRGVGSTHRRRDGRYDPPRVVPRPAVTRFDAKIPHTAAIQPHEHVELEQHELLALVHRVRERLKHRDELRLARYARRLPRRIAVGDIPLRARGGEVPFSRFLGIIRG